MSTLGSESKINGTIYENIICENLNKKLYESSHNGLLFSYNVICVGNDQTKSVIGTTTSSKTDLKIIINNESKNISIKNTNIKSQLHLTPLSRYVNYMKFAKHDVSDLFVIAMKKYLGETPPNEQELKDLSKNRTEKNKLAPRFWINELTVSEQKEILSHITQYKTHIINMAACTGYTTETIDFFIIANGLYNNKSDDGYKMYTREVYMRHLLDGDPHITTTGNIMLSNTVNMQRKGSGNNTKTFIQINVVKCVDLPDSPIFSLHARTQPSNKYKGLSLFACAGIAEHLLNDTCVEILVANELLGDRCEFYTNEYPNTEMIQGDIAKVYENIIKSSTSKGIDFILATPPCQSFSTAGSNKVNDKRTPLFEYVINAINDINPKYAMIENVPSFWSSKYSSSAETIGQKFERLLGNKYHIENKILDASHFGVAQIRKRNITLLSRNDCKPWIHPVGNATNTITVRNAIGHLPSLESGESSNVHRWHKALTHNSNHVLWMKHTPTGKSAFTNPVYFPQILDKKTGQLRKIKGFGNTYARMKWDEPAPTITMASGCISSQTNVHPGEVQPDGTYNNARALTIYELILLTGLKDTWGSSIINTGGKEEKLLRDIIGEAIPPMLTLSIIKTLPQYGNELNKKPNVKKLSVKKPSVRPKRIPVRKIIFSDDSDSDNN